MAQTIQPVIDPVAQKRETGKKNVKAEKLAATEPKPFLQMTRPAIEAYIDANTGNVADLRKVVKQLALVTYELGQIVLARES